MPQQPASSGQAPSPSPCDVKALNECLQRTNGDMQQVLCVQTLPMFILSQSTVHC
jgi:hypothetical protein